MTIPAVMFIEMASDGLQRQYTEDPTVLEHELKELRALGEGRVSALAMKASSISSGFELGYLLGLETARTLLAMNVAAVQANVTL